MEGAAALPEAAEVSSSPVLSSPVPAPPLIESCSVDRPPPAQPPKISNPAEGRQPPTLPMLQVPNRGSYDWTKDPVVSRQRSPWLKQWSPLNVPVPKTYTAPSLELALLVGATYSSDDPPPAFLRLGRHPPVFGTCFQPIVSPFDRCLSFAQPSSFEQLPHGRADEGGSCSLFRFRLPIREEERSPFPDLASSPSNVVSASRAFKEAASVDGRIKQGGALLFFR
ncbi:hypothetical protein KSP40_PGU008687 [Platanthera guangdongensis]|uniref:Uncharacterized protein n=1 Tax=Platanthera guangdongensis TaxID=2320717 RepID=A0ABR2M8M2_9ASPA